MVQKAKQVKIQQFQVVTRPDSRLDIYALDDFGQLHRKMIGKTGDWEVIKGPTMEAVHE